MRVASVAVRVLRVRKEAERARSKAQHETMEAVRRLTELGLSRCDAAELLGLSHQTGPTAP